MKKLVLILMMFICSVVYAEEVNPDFFTHEELSGIWHNQKWPLPLRDAFGFIDIGEKDYETIYFVGGKYYEFLASDEKYLLHDDVKIHNINDYKLEESNINTQWIGLYSALKWIYLGISKITPATSVKKEIDGRVLIDLRPGDMILTYYSNEGKIVYRKQFRKVTATEKSGAE